MSRKRDAVGIKTVNQRHALDLAFRGISGLAELTDWAKKSENRGDVYRMWVSLAKKVDTVKHQHSVTLLSPEERDRRIAELLAQELKAASIPNGQFELPREDTHQVGYKMQMALTGGSLLGDIPGAAADDE